MSFWNILFISLFHSHRGQDELLFFFLSVHKPLTSRLRNCSFSFIIMVAKVSYLFINRGRQRKFLFVLGHFMILRYAYVPSSYLLRDTFDFSKNKRSDIYSWVGKVSVCWLFSKIFVVDVSLSRNHFSLVLKLLQCNWTTILFVPAIAITKTINFSKSL